MTCCSLICNSATLTGVWQSVTCDTTFFADPAYADTIFLQGKVIWFRLILETVGYNSVDLWSSGIWFATGRFGDSGDFLTTWQGTIFLQSGSKQQVWSEQLNNGLILHSTIWSSCEQWFGASLCYDLNTTVIWVWPDTGLSTRLWFADWYWSGLFRLELQTASIKSRACLIGSNWFGHWFTYSRLCPLRTD